MLKYKLLMLVIIFVSCGSVVGASQEAPLREIPSLERLSRRAVVQYEPNIILDQLPSSVAQADPMLRDTALRNAFRRFGLNVDLQRIRDLVGEKPERLYYTRQSRADKVFNETPIDFINPGQAMDDDQRLLMDLLRQGYKFDFNTPVGQRLVKRAVENKNIDFVDYALNHGFDIKKYQKDLEMSVPYTLFRDYSQDILLSFLHAASQDQSSDAFVPVVRELLKSGAVVKRHHIEAAKKAHNKALENLFINYFNQQDQGSSTSILPMSHEPVGFREQLTSHAPVLNPAALTAEPQLPFQEESKEDEKEEEEQQKPKKSSRFDIFKRKK